MIHYHRPPDRTDIYVQAIIHEAPDVIVTCLENIQPARTISIADQPALENGSAIVWFTFPDARHDIGRFHLADGRYTGLYANIIEPVDIISRNEWHTTDLFLDVWVDPSGHVQLLDEDELDDAVAHGWVTENTASGARAEARRILADARAGSWPPAIVHEWTLERVLGTLKHRRG